MKRTYRGSCHCKAVRFECELDLSLETSRCNCSACLKGRYWKAMAGPENFRLLQGDEVLTRYNFGSGNITHRFCSRCGTKPFAHVKMNRDKLTMIAVNVACLDDASDAEFAAAPVRFQNGRENHWDTAPAETGFL